MVMSDPIYKLILPKSRGNYSLSDESPPVFGHKEPEGVEDNKPHDTAQFHPEHHTLQLETRVLVNEMYSAYQIITKQPLHLMEPGCGLATPG